MPVPLLVSNLRNIRYLSGVNLTDGLMLMRRPNSLLLFVDSRYTEKAADEAKRGIRVVHVEKLPATLTRFRRLGFEAEDITVARLKRWQKKFRGITFVPMEGVVEKWRRTKRSEELRAIRKACSITDSVMRAVGAALGPPGGTSLRDVRLSQGITEKDLAWQIEKLSRELGADAMAFETIVAFGPSTSRPHHRPTERKLRKGDLIQIDMGVKVKGYCSDCSRVFFTGKATPEQQKIFDLLLSIVKETTTMAKTGALNRSLDAFARKRLEKFGYEKLFLHSLGHGVGLDIHEGVNLSSKAKKMPLLRNEVVTTEPGIYFEGKWGMRIEDTILVTKKGGVRLTNALY